MRWSQEVRPRPTLFGFVVPNQASNKHRRSLKWAEGKRCVLVMQGTLFSSKLRSPFQSSAKNRCKEPQPQGQCLEGPCNPQWCWMYFEESQRTVKNWFQAVTLGRTRLLGRTFPKSPEVSRPCQHCSSKSYLFSARKSGILQWCQNCSACIVNTRDLNPNGRNVLGFPVVDLCAVILWEAWAWEERSSSHSGQGQHCIQPHLLGALSI